MSTITEPIPESKTPEGECDRADAPLTWQHLVAVEPRLARLEWWASGARGWREWENIKRTLARLVGWHACRRELASSAVYELAYRHLLSAFERGTEAEATPVTATETTYPKRPKFFSNRAIRLMMKTFICQEIGTTAFALLVVVAETEDVTRYVRAATFWDSQLMDILGASVGTIITARKKAVAAGWLHYEPGRKGIMGRYWVTVPESANGLSDIPLDDGHPDEITQEIEVDSEESTPNFEGKGDLHSKNGDANAFTNNSQAQSKHVPFIPIPKPAPNGSLFVQTSENDGLGNDTAEPEHIPEVELLAAWNATNGVRKSRGHKLTPHRRRALKSRLADPEWDWRAALGKFPLRCNAGEPDGRKPDLDWFLKPDSVNKLLEGKYDWEKSHALHANRPQANSDNPTRAKPASDDEYAFKSAAS